MSQSDDDRDDLLFEELFAVAAKQAPSAEQLARWQEHFRNEIRPAPRRRLSRLGAAAAAGLAALIVATAWLTWTRPAAPVPPVVAEVIAAVGGNVVRTNGVIDRSLVPGSAIRDGERVESGLQSGLAARYRTADVRLHANTSVVFSENRLKLRHGAVYLDVPVVASTGSPLRVDTPLGSFTHAGTQFQVSVSDAGVSGAVREGAIVLHRDGRDIRLAARDGQGRMVRITRSGGLEESPVPTTGALWAWTMQTAPGIVVAGRSPAEVLEWLARQQGKHVVYTSSAAEQLAHDRRFAAGSHAAIRQEDVISTVDATTHLRAVDTGDDRIVVSLDSEGDQDAH